LSRRQKCSEAACPKQECHLERAPSHYQSISSAE
jgi:hypothetical protein